MFFACSYANFITIAVCLILNGNMLCEFELPQ